MNRLKHCDGVVRWVALWCWRGFMLPYWCYFQSVVYVGRRSTGHQAQFGSYWTGSTSFFLALALNTVERSTSSLCHIDFETSIFFFLVLLVCFRNSDKKSDGRSVKSDARRWESLQLNEIYSISKSSNARWTFFLRRTTQTWARGADARKPVYRR